MRIRSHRKSAVLSRCIEPLESRQLLAATHLAFLTQPTTAVAGSTIAPDVVVAVEDGSNKIVTGDSSSVKVAIKTSTGATGATLGGTLTISAVKGIATFSDLSLTAAGTGSTAYALTATDGSLTAANSSSFDVAPAAPKQLAFNKGPTAAKAGAVISPAITVDVEDQYGNVVISNSSNVTLAIKTGPAGAPINGQLTDGANSGEASFDDISLETAGSYTLTATDGKLTADVSDTFTISAGTATQVAFATQPVSAVAGSTLAAITAQVEDKFGNLCTTNTSKVTVATATKPDGTSTLNGTLQQSAVAGVATFDDLTLLTAGAYTLGASDSSLTAGVSSPAFTITGKPASRLILTSGNPSNVVAGVNIAPALVVDLWDQYSNLITTDTSKVTATIKSGPDGAKLGGTVTVPVVKGVATFSALSLSVAGNYSLTFTDGTLDTTSTGTFAVAPNAATQLAFGQGVGPAVVGGVITPSVTVKVEDKLGNVVTNDSSSVTLSVATGPTGGLHPGIQGDVVVSTHSGVATFDDWGFLTAGTYTIKATDGKLTPVTSGAFVFSPDVASQVAITSTTPASVVAGASIAPAVVVQVQDQWGNLITTDTSSVTLTIGTGPDGGVLAGTATVAAVKGVATFTNLSFNIASDSGYTLKATDASLDTDTSSAIKVTAGAPTQLVFKKGPTDAKAGAAISPAVTVLVEDKFGNTVTTDKSIVTIAIATSPSKTPPKKISKTKGKVGDAPTAPTIAGTLTVAAVNGLATFSDLSLNLVGAYTLAVTDAKLTTAVSSSINITPGTATQVAFGTQPVTTVAGVTLTAPTVQVEDAFGNVVASNTSDITVAIATGPTGGTLTGTKKETAIASVATFDSLVLQTAGTYTLTATDGSLTPGTSASFIVTPAAAASIAINQGPTAEVAGVANSPAVTVQVLDAFGNLVTTDKSKVTAALGTKPDGAALTGTSSVAAVAGVATFSGLVLNTAGSYTLAFTDGTLTGDTSDSFTISPSTPTQLAFGQAPTTAAAGVKLSPSVTVKVEDKFGNVVTTDTSQVTIGTATVPIGGAVGTLSSARAVSGVATFSKLAFNLAGSYSLKATDAKLTAATSAAFAITPGTAAKVAFASNPTAAVAGAKIAPAITVQVLDAFGNVVTTDTSNVKVDISDGTDGNGATLAGTATIAAVKGVATFSDLNITTAGAYRLTATDGSLTSSLSNTFKISPAAAAKLAFDQGPRAITAGDTFDAITVDVEDKFGNLVTTDASKVSIGSAVADPKGSTLGGTLTVTAVNGVATFSDLVPHTASTSENLVAFEAKLTSTVSDDFVVTADSAAKLVVGTAPAATAVAGTTLAGITILVEDQFGNVCTTNTSDVTLALGTNPDGSTLGGTKKETAVAGVATFADLSLQTAGTYTLSATDGSLTGTATGSFVISPAAASKLAFGQAPTGEVAGVAISPAVTVSVEDAFGNVVTTDVSKITASLNTSPTGSTLGGTIMITAVKGIATFSTLKLTTAGSYKIAMADGSLTGVTSGSITITPAAAAKLVFGTGPAGAAHTATLADIKVDVTDAFGNIIAGDSSGVTIAIATTTATSPTLGGTLMQSASSGVATFDDLTLDKAGAYTVKVTDGTLTVATSSSFAIS